MKRFSAIAVAIAVVVLGTHAGLQSTAEAGTTFGEVSIDMDISDGACTDIDATRAAATGDPSFEVAVCIENMQEQPASFDFEVLYDDAIIVAPETANAGTGLDDNPDANAGSTTFGGTNLGSGWDCSGGGLDYPTGDEIAGAGGRAFSGRCSSVAGPYTLGVTGVLSVITFNIVGGGTSSLELANVVVTGESGLEAGTCEPVISFETVCNDGSITVTGAGATPTPTGTATSTPAATNTPCTGVCPSATATFGPDPMTPTPTATAGTPGEEPPPVEPGEPGEPGGGAGPGQGVPTRTGITLPDTGDGSGGGTSGWGIGLMLAMTAVVIGAATGGKLLFKRTRGN